MIEKKMEKRMRGIFVHVHHLTKRIYLVFVVFLFEEKD
jgi:hypothetical protein